MLDWQLHVIQHSTFSVFFSLIFTFGLHSKKSRSDRTILKNVSPNSVVANVCAPPSLTVQIFIVQLLFYAPPFCRHSIPFLTPLSWNNPAWRICGRLIKNFWGTSGELISCNRVGVGKCYGSPPTVLRSGQNTLIFVFHLEMQWESTFTQMGLQVWEHTDSMFVCVCAQTRKASNPIC